MKIHFVGVAGTGMSALAQIRAMGGDEVTGSDRLADQASLGDTQRRLEAAGIRLFAQDGSGIDEKTGRVVVSTAIEAGNADLAKAKALAVPVVHRADELAHQAGERKTIAVAGTSGKSTVTGMVYEILRSAGRSPSLASGATVPSLRRKGLLGNAVRGASDLLVMEADESDGTIDRYSPHLGLLLNISKDHKGMDELLELFRGFKRRSRRLVVNADAPSMEEFEPGAATFGFKKGALRGTEPKLTPEGSSFEVDGVRFELKVPGRYNAENALAAAAACLELGVPLEDSAKGLAVYEGVGRRFEVIGRERGVEVVDDYAHNPEKVRAALSAAHLRAKRVLAVFQLHGFAPARFMKAEFIDAFAEALEPQDLLWLPDIYYVGGTAAKDVSAADYARLLSDRKVRAVHVPDRALIAGALAVEAREGDLILIMGARDATLSDFAADVLRRLRK